MTTFTDLIGVSREEIPSHIFSAAADVDVYEDPPARTYLSSMSQGFSLVVNDGRVTAVQIYVQSNDGFEAFDGELPLSIRANMTVDDLSSKFGHPSSGSSGIFVFTLRDVCIQLIVQYDEKNLMEMISLEERVGTQLG